MRKIYLLLFATLFSMFATVASAVNITLNIDDPTRVKVQVNYVDYEIVAGDNQLDVSEYASVYIQVTNTEKYFLTGVVRSSDGGNEMYSTPGTSCSLYVSSSSEGQTWTVTSVEADDLRDGSCTVKVDDASKVKITRSKTYTTVGLVDGENTVKYITDSELPLSIGPANYGETLYKVTLNGEDVESTYGSYIVTPANGDVIEVFASFPDKDVPITFTYASEEAKGYITSVTVDGVEVADYNASDFKVKLGSNVAIAVNQTDYKLNVLNVNGNDIYSVYGSYSFVVTAEENTIYVDAEKYKTLNATLNVTNPEHLTVYKGYYYNNDIITLDGTENAIEVNEVNAQIQIKANSGCYVTSVTSSTPVEGGEPVVQSYTADFNDMYTVTISEGMTITVESGAIERNLMAMIYVDDKSAAQYGIDFSRSDRSAIDIENGYNKVAFYDGDNPFGISIYQPLYNNVYVNDTKVEPYYAGGSSYQVTFADGDVIKVFLASDPATYTVDFDVTIGDDESVSVTRDRIVKVEDYTSFTTLQDTEVSFTVDAANPTVTVNDETITADDEGNYTFTVTGDTKVGINSVYTGITTVATEGVQSVNVYNMQGMLVLKNANAGDMGKLPAGVYIMNGRKVVKR